MLKNMEINSTMQAIILKILLNQIQVLIHIRSQHQVHHLVIRQTHVINVAKLVIGPINVLIYKKMMVVNMVGRVVLVPMVKVMDNTAVQTEAQLVEGKKNVSTVQRQVIGLVTVLSRENKETTIREMDISVLNQTER